MVVGFPAPVCIVIESMLLSKNAAWVVDSVAEPGPVTPDGRLQPRQAR